MDRRFEPRYPSDLRVHVTILEDGGHSVQGVLVNLSESGICALMDARVAEQSLVKIQIGNTVVYGQASHISEENGKFRTGFTVEQVLLRTSDLTTILRALLNEQQLVTMEPVGS